MAKKHGKKYVDALKLIDETKLYSPKEAVELVKKTVVTKFDSSVEASFRLGPAGSRRNGAASWNR